MKKIEFNKENDDLVIYFYGDVDNQACKEYKNNIIDTLDMFPYLNVILDFSNVTFIDSSGIGLILVRYNQLKSKNRLLSVRGVNRNVDRLFEVSGLYKLIKSEKKVSI